MTRQLQQVIPALAASEGAGVKIKRSLGQGPGARLDPILMLDEFNSDNAEDYLAGFPSHPHRGFETVTYMLDGHMLHEDHMGNRGDLRSGDVQWMSAGRGIIHSEMPQQLDGRMRGFQLWINLPAAQKMKPAGYRDIRATEIPTAELGEGATAKVIAGQITTPNGVVEGPMTGLYTEPVYWDLSLPAQTKVSVAVPGDHQLFVYPFEGDIQVGDDRRELNTSQAGILTKGESLTLHSLDAPARCLIIGGRALNEPIAQYGPFVMNTTEEIEQAINDYRNGTLAG